MKTVSTENDFADVRILLGTTVPSTTKFFAGHISELQARGADVIIATNAPEDAVPPISTTQIHHIPMQRSWAPFEDFAALRRWRQAILTIRPHVLHVVTPKASLLGALATLTLQPRKRPRLVVSVFGLRQQNMRGPAKALLDATTRLTTWAADVVWVDSESLAQLIKNRKLAPRARIRVLGPGSVDGVDAECKFNPHRGALQDSRKKLRSQLSINENELVVGYVGRVTRDKGISELLDSFHYAQQLVPERLHLVIVGPDENDTPELMRATVGKETIHRVPATPDVAPWLSSFDIFVMPSHREGFGMSNIEAASMGLPVISTLIPGCTDSVANGVTGTLVPPGDAQALAGAIARYVSDPDLRHRHGSAGRERVSQEFQPDVLRSHLRAVYKSLITEKRPLHSRRLSRRAGA